ncbi:MAG TPA: PAS domain S-box protein [Gallionellaceae bacterium]|nr:PAS domain S-box protein [Gallionellaceae bacterium]
MPASATALTSSIAPDSRSNYLAQTKLAAALFLPAALAVSLLAYALLKADAEARLQELKVQETGEVKVAANLLSRNLADAISDLRLLAHTPALQQFLDSHGSSGRAGLTQHFINLSATKGRYDQIRFLDQRGMEIIRVNRIGNKSVAVPAAELQGKTARYFFAETIKLQPGKIYISPLDLNIEHGQIEQPYKPMLRIATPIANGAGRAQGILILNYFGQELLDDFTRAMVEGRHAMLLNRDGYWLRHPDHRREWGFMFGRNDTFGHDYPEEWNRIAREAQGSLLGQNGLFTFATVHPLPAEQARNITVAQDYYWKIVSRVAPDELPAATPHQYPRTFLLYGVTLALLAALAWYVARTLRSRQRMNGKILENEARLLEITSTVAEGLYVINASGLTTYLNPEAERLLGWSADELMGKHVHSLVHHHHANGLPIPANECEIYRVIQSGKVYHSNTQVFWRKDGSSFPVEVSASPIVREGKIAGAVVAFSDISVQMQNELALRNSRSQLQQAQHLAQLGSWELNLVTQQLDWSDEIFRIFEIEPSAFGASHEAFLNLIHPDDRERVKQAYVDSVARHLPYHIEHRLQFADGRIKHVVERGETFYDGNGRPCRSIGTVQDITDRKAAQEALRTSEKTARALLNANTESAILIDIKGTVLAINKVGAQRLHKEIDDLLNHNIYDFIPPEVAEARRKMADTAISSGKPVRFQDERNGLSLDNNLHPISDAHGKVGQIAIYSVDITERKKLEAEEALLQHIDQQVLRSSSLSSLLQFICDEVVAKFGYPLAWLGKKESDGSVSMSAQSGKDRGYAHELLQIGVRWDDAPQGRGPTGESIRHNKPQTFRISDPAFEPWRNAAARHGFSAIAAFPLVVRGEVYGALMLYSPREQEFDDGNTMQHLSAIAGRICVALEMAMDQQQLRLLSSALASAGNAIFIADPQGRIQWVNNAFTILTGYTEREAIGQPPSMLKSGKQDAEFYRKLWKSLQKGKTWSSETVERHKTGMLFTVQQTITPILNEAGQITHYISILDDITAQKEIAARIQYMAHFDSLTSLPNRTLFYDRLHQVLAQAKRDGMNCALMFLDLDRFKAVNDTLGHHIGDLLLQEVAHRTKACVRESDTVARLAGDEFTVLLPHVHTPQDAAVIAEKIIASLSQPFQLEGHEAHIGCSIGIAFYPTDAGTDDDLIKCADGAMYVAKEQGRGTFRFYQAPA